MLQAVGGLRRQIRGTIWMEALTIGLIGLIMGMAPAPSACTTCSTVSAEFRRHAPGLHFPFGIVGLLVPVILGAAFGSAAVPGGERRREFISGGSGI